MSRGLGRSRVKKEVPEKQTDSAPVNQKEKKTQIINERWLKQIIGNWIENIKLK